MQLAFKCYDPDGSGTVDASELYKILHTLVGASRRQQDPRACPRHALLGPGARFWGGAGATRF